MPNTSRKYLPYLVLLLLSIPLFFMNIHEGHALGDDFAQYIKEGINIAHGRPFYESNYIFNKYNTEYAPAQYPPGFPLMLAPVIGSLGLSFPALFYFNSFIFVCLLFALFAYFRKYTGDVAAICLCVLLIYSEYMLDLKQQVLSDVPCLLFVTLYLLYRNATEFSWLRIAGLVLFATMAILIRSQAILLLVAEAIYLLIWLIKTLIKSPKLAVKQLVRMPSIYVVAGSLLLITFLYKTVFYSPVSTDSFYRHFIDVTLALPLDEIAEKQLGALLATISGFFYYEEHNGFFKIIISFIGSMALVFTITGFILTIKKRLAVDDIFFLLMCLLVVYLPVHDKRYFLNALPLLFYYFYVTLRIVSPAFTSVDRRIVAVILTLMYLRLGFATFKKSVVEVGDYFPQKRDKIAFQYLAKNVNNQDIIVFTKPRLLTLFTGKKSINVAWQIPQAMNKKIFDSLQVKYMLVIDQLDEGYYKDYLQNIQHPVDSARISEGYTLYKLR